MAGNGLTLTQGKKKSLEDWIHEAVTDEDKKTPLTQLTLVHRSGMQEVEIHTSKLEKGGRIRTPKEYAELFRGKAEIHAQDLPGMQTFYLLAFWGRGEPESRYVVLINKMTDPSAQGTEAPTAEGRTMQAMRWQDGFLSQVFQRQAAQDFQSTRMIEMQGGIISKLMQENRDSFEIVKDCMMKMMENQQDFMMKHAEYTRNSRTREQLLTMAPALVNSIAGREVFPQSSEDTALVDAIAEGVKPEQIAMLAHLVPPSLAGPLMDRLGRALDAKAEREKAATAAAKAASTAPDLLDSEK